MRRVFQTNTFRFCVFFCLCRVVVVTASLVILCARLRTHAKYPRKPIMIVYAERSQCALETHKKKTKLASVNSIMEFQNMDCATKTHYKV